VSINLTHDRAGTVASHRVSPALATPHPLKECSMSATPRDRSSSNPDPGSASDAEVREWESLPEPQLLAAAFVRILDFARTPSDDGFVPVEALYRIVVRRLSVEQRLMLESRVCEYVSEMPGYALALLVLTLVEPDPRVSSSAVIDFTMVMPRIKGDPLTGPTVLAHDLRSGSLTPGQQRAVLTGLVLLGDERVLPLVRGGWRLLESAEDRRLLAAAASGSVSTLLIEFLLDWLEHTTDERDIGAIAGAMVRMPAISRHGVVVREERTFPASEAENQGEPPIRYLAMWPFDEYLEVIRPRLEAVIAKEPEPKVLPAIIEAWSLGTQSTA
jgi:hypothetical protein